MEHENKILVGNAFDHLKQIPPQSVNCVVTSPPYYGLRDYGVAGQLGLEETPEEFITKLKAMFRLVRHTLKRDGTLWLNLGDSYWGAGNNRGNTKKLSEKQRSNQGANGQVGAIRSNWDHPYLKQKDLIGIPWRVALALQEDGWFLRSDIIWHKTNPMPESVRDRPTKSHEYIFLFSKSEDYYYDFDAIKEPVKANSLKRQQSGWNGNKERGWVNGNQNNMDRWMGKASADHEMRNKRSVWTVGVSNFKGAHFATFPPKLIEPCILAGSREGGIILDPFFGSGTTGIVANQLKRKFVGIELNPEFAKIAFERTGLTKPRVEFVRQYRSKRRVRGSEDVAEASV